MAREKVTNFPTVPFDGQEFVDAYRIKWQYDGSAKCWRRIGTVPEVPLATGTQTGLLSAKQKELLDSIPAKGGHFGIIAKPLLGLIPRDLPTELTDKTFGAVENESGTSIQGIKPRRGEPYVANTYDGKFLRFTKGPLQNSTFLVYTNDTESILVQGDATEARHEDEFIVFDPLAANEHGVVMGDVEIKSETLDITCVDSSNEPMAFSEDCRLDYKDNDGGPQSPGLDFKVSDKVLDSFCVELRPCKGPDGSKGLTGATGADGTGDGPTGEMGNPGEDAPTVGHAFTGIKFVESDDVYDSAVVGLELNPDEGKLNIIKAKMIVPDDDTPATQLVATPVDRSLDWTDNEFGYNLLKPGNDPIETKEEDDADVTLGAYHKNYEIVTEGLPEDIEASRVAQLNGIQLSGLLNKAIAYFKERLGVIEEDYNRDIKKFIEEKDTAARAILAGLAQQVAECEWQMPVEFCVGITPDVCHEGGDEDGGDGGGGGGGGTAVPTPWPTPIPRFPTPDSISTPDPITVPPLGGGGSGGGGGAGGGSGGGAVVEITEENPPYPSTTPVAPTVPPPDPFTLTTYLVNIFGSPFVPSNAAVAFTYIKGAIRSSSSAWEVPLIAILVNNGVQTISSGGFTAVKNYDPHDLNAVEKAYKRGDPNSGLVNDGRTFIIADTAPVDQIYLTLRTKGPIREGNIHMKVDVIYDRSDPPAGVPINVTATVAAGGSAPKGTDPIITGVSPNLIQEGVPTPISIVIGSDGGAAQTGATVEFLGPTATTFATTAVTDREITGDLTITPGGPAFPAPQDYDVMVVNPDGSNGLGTSVVTST